MKNALFVLLLGGLFFFAGCTSPSQTGATQYVCPDGTTVVNSPANCPAGGTSPQTTAPTAPVTQTPPQQQTAPPEEERELSDLCVTVPEEELGTYNVSSSEFDCYSDLYFEGAMEGDMDEDDCAEILFPFIRAGCNGFYAGFINDNSICLSLSGDEKDFCLYSYAGSSAENRESSASIHLCDGIVDEEMMAECIELISPYLPCQSDDGICPEECNYLSDNDCPTYSLGQKSITKGGMEITISGPSKIRHCYTDYDSEYLDDSEYGYFYVLSINVKNGGTTKQYALSSDFVLIDSTGIQHDADWYVMGESCEDANEFEGGEMYPGSTESAQLWFELGNQRSLPAGETKIIYDPNTFIDGDEIIYIPT